MPYVPVNLILDKQLNINDAVDIAYPEGKNEGFFFSGVTHSLSISGNFFRAPRDFIIKTTADHFTFIWRGDRPIARGTLLNIQLDAPGGDFHFDQKAGITVQNMVACPLFLVNLSAPSAEDPEFYFKGDGLIDTRPVVQRNHKVNTPRNITITSTHDLSHVTFTFFGEDIYTRAVVEQVKGPKSGTAVGSKAFANIKRIVPSEPVKHEFSIGKGRKLGLPVYLPGPAFLVREIVNGKEVKGGTVIPGETEVPSATTGDRRGTYTPPSDIILNRQNSIHLLLSLPNPGNIGVPDFAG